MPLSHGSASPNPRCCARWIPKAPCAASSFSVTMAKRRRPCGLPLLIFASCASLPETAITWLASQTSTCLQCCARYIQFSQMFTPTACSTHVLFCCSTCTPFPFSNPQGGVTYPSPTPRPPLSSIDFAMPTLHPRGGPGGGPANAESSLEHSRLVQQLNLSVMTAQFGGVGGDDEAADGSLTKLRALADQSTLKLINVRST